MTSAPSPLTGLGVSMPVLAAPMAGGPSTPALVTAAARAAGIGFIAGGYKTRDSLAAQISAVRATGVPFGVNVFAPNPVPVDRDAFTRYVEAIRPEADRYGLSLPDQPREDDDNWSEKIDLLLSDPVPIVSFTFGIPPAQIIATLRRAGSLVMQTVTSVAEARLAADAGADMLAVQSAAAGGHSGTLTPAAPPVPEPIGDLVGRVRNDTGLPIVAAGGLATPHDVAAVLDAGACAAVVGTMLLRSLESGASAVHQAALAHAGPDATVVTRAFSGRPARGLRNEFIDDHEALAPLGYPAVHHLTSPLRKAAAAAGDQQRLNLWSGTGYRYATADPAAEILTRLASRL